MLTIFGFHTDDKLYKKHAEILSLSAKKFSIKVDFTEISQDDWQKIIALKPSFIAQMRRKLKGPILYVDADAIILQDIRPFFNSIKEDIAVHYINDERLLSGTIFINDTPNAHVLVDEWEKRMLANPNIWDQIILERLLAEWIPEGKVSVSKLPPNYTFIFDTSIKAYGPSVEPMIEHLQASRDMRWKKKYIGRSKMNQFFMTIPYLKRSTRKIMRRHHHINKRMNQLGIDMTMTLNDVLD